MKLKRLYRCILDSDGKILYTPPTMKYLIFGKGYIAHKFRDHIGSDAIMSPVDITDYRAVSSELKSHKPDVVINCAGKTGKPNIDWCEDHKLETLTSNVTGPLTLLRVCSEERVYFVHIGSGCVYSGDNNGRGFSEEDPPNFFGSFYSNTKIWSEAALKDYPVLQLRLRMPMDGQPGPRNFITKITQYSKIISLPNSMSVLDDFLRAGMTLIEKRATGIYNMTNPGAIEHKEILDMYRDIVDPSFTYEIFSLDEMNTLTKAGRSNCVLSSDKRETASAHMRPIHEAVRAILEQYRKNLGA